ncbi:TspO/MBR family protein [Clostridium sp.]|uniref:TspO/MBR family protein n=1 Tax=Clostridium sp. TaxID=1506 RepID=UPI001D976345|nr:TspO/MBR family protein [Clostridium sp.]MBS5938506.1 tryptophan-rich sensory protein [Clostridium sp.]
MKSVLKKDKKYTVKKENKRINKTIPLLINIMIPILAIILIGYINRNTLDTYRSLKGILVNEMVIIFPVGYGIIYILMGVSAYRIYMRNKSGVDDKGAYFTYFIQLCINFIWPFLFFTFRLYGLSFIWLIILLVAVLITFYKFFRVDKFSSALLIPYIAWIVFISFLNYFIWFYNEM